MDLLTTLGSTTRKSTIEVNITRSTAIRSNVPKGKYLNLNSKCGTNTKRRKLGVGPRLEDIWPNGGTMAEEKLGRLTY
jgi:hypothetical protein